MAGAEKGKAGALSVSEQLDRELAAAALEKRRRGQNPTGPERAALRRVEKAREETQRWDHYHAIPQKHWREMSGRHARILKDQAAQYGIPFGDREVDLPAVVRALHDFLAANQYRLREAAEPDTKGGVTLAEGKRRYEAARAAREERRNQLEAGKVRPTEEVDAERMELVRWVVGIMERAGAELQSRCAAAKPAGIKRLVDAYFLEVRQRVVDENGT